MTHTRKIAPVSFDALTSGQKTVEIRREDETRFAVGDVLTLREWDIHRVPQPYRDHYRVLHPAAVAPRHFDPEAYDAALTKGYTGRGCSRADYAHCA